MHAIEVNNVTKIYRKGVRGIRIPAVVDLSFSVTKGTVTGFVGPNGAGKTTTIKMAIGLVFPTAGTLRIHGRDACRPEARQGVAYLSEQPYFYSHLTVEEMLRFTGRLIRLPPSSLSGEIGRVLELVELAHRKRAKIRELSKGMQQRLNMAQALLGSPHTLVLDEPMSGMDPPGRRLFRELMRSLHDEKRTLFFSTHVLDDVEMLCDDVIVLQKGRLSYAGKVSTLLEEGFSGTEIVTGTLIEKCRARLRDAGCSITLSEPDGACTVLVPATGDAKAAQGILHEYSIWPESVVRRSMPLEELLYRREKEHGS